MKDSTKRIVVAWHGLPAYAARLIRQAAGNFPVIATRPVVPIVGMDEMLPGRIRWIDDHYCGGWAGLGIDVPDLYFQPSWNTPAFNQLGAEVRRRGGQIVVMFDNPWRGTLRQRLGAVRFRTQWRDRFSAAWVCGRLGHRLARYWGFREEQIFQGMYGSDPRVFAESQMRPLADRPQKIVFVGRLVDHKGIRDLLNGWRNFSSKHPEWELHIYGTGPREQEVMTASSRVYYHGFQQPEAIAIAMKSARFLILPSHDEHWGLVVCEAAQAGCGLLLSANVGAAPDLVGLKNGRTFKAGDSRALAKCLEWAASRLPGELNEIAMESLALGGQYTPTQWCRTMENIIEAI